MLGTQLMNLYPNPNLRMQRKKREKLVRRLVFKSQNLLAYALLGGQAWAACSDPFARRLAGPPATARPSCGSR